MLTYDDYREGGGSTLWHRRFFQKRHGGSQGQRRYWGRKVGRWKIRIKEEQSGCYETVRTNKTHLHSHTAFILIPVEPS
jgi:hypothetical protein